MPTPPPRRLASTAHELYQKKSTLSHPPQKTQVEIKDVWASTLDAEMAVIRELVERYPYVAMDTEFPGVVAKPVGDLSSNGFAYQTLQCNVDLLKIIQLGISFCGENGETPAERGHDEPVKPYEVCRGRGGVQRASSRGGY